MNDFDNDEPTAPAPPRFIRRLAQSVGLVETPVPGVREATEAVRAAKAREAEAREAASIATAERQRAEKALGPAQQQAKQAADMLTQAVTVRLKALEAQLDRVRARDQADKLVPEPNMRIRARAFLHGGGEMADVEGRGTGSGPSGLTSLVALDSIAGSWYEASRVGGQLMQHVWDQGGDDALADRADQLECEGWRGCMNRIKFLAGEL
jgi:hypothetical protein